MTYTTTTPLLSKLRLIVLGLLVFIICAFGALGAVWIRQEITSTAHHTLGLERDLTQFEREYAYTQAKIAEYHNPEKLKGIQVAHLAHPTQKQIVWVNNRLDVRRTNQALAYNTSQREILPRLKQ